MSSTVGVGGDKGTNIVKQSMANGIMVKEVEGCLKPIKEVLSFSPKSNFSYCGD